MATPNPNDLSPAGNKWTQLALGTSVFALSFFAWSLIAPFAKTFKQDFGLSYTEALLLTAAPVVLGSLLRIPIGALTDKHGGRIVLTLLLGASALPAFLFGFANSYWSVVAVGTLLGMAGASFASGVGFVAKWFPASQQGLALGIFGVGNGGTAIAFFSAPLAVERWGRPTFSIATAAILVVAALLFYVFARDAPNRGKAASYRETWQAGWRLHRLSFFYAITFGGFVAMGFLLPTVLQDWFGFSVAEAAARAAGFIVIATLVRPLGGWLADRIGGYPVLIMAFAGIAADAAVLASTAKDPLIVPVTVACLSMGAFLGMGNGAIFKIVALDFPKSTGTASGIVGAAGGLGGFFPPIFVGIAKDVEGTYTFGFVGLLISVFVALTLAIWLISGLLAQQYQQERA